ncbi:MAG TPA: tetratricopeptide repeat protein [Burkholderiales bacterium]|nr:tetratricopeptide repeat protein [Burkholderiales bacterium]
MITDARGLAVSTESEESLAGYERALGSLHASRGDAVARIEETLARDPHFVAGHCLLAGALILAGDVPDRERLAAAIRSIERERGRANDRELRHAFAAHAVLEGDEREALERYGDLLVDYPTDSLALQIAQAFDFRLGQRELLRDRVAQVLPHWNEGMPGFGYVLGMYAFGLEEAGDYAQAEALARRALELEPDNAAATHVVAHVLEMQGRAREGIAFLESTRPVWAHNAGFAIHNTWHLALFHLDLDEINAALAIYDQALAPHPASPASALVDASALLWRFELRGIDLRNRWRVLARFWRHRPLEGQRAFNLMHAVMAFTAAGETALADRMADLLRESSAVRAASAPDDLKVAVPLSDALQAFGRGDYARAVERMNEVRGIAYRCGGSLAQCDFIHLTMIEAALRSQRARLARALAAERTARKPQSALNRLLLARAGAAATLLQAPAA